MIRPKQTVYISVGNDVYYFDAVIKAQHTSTLKIEDDPSNASGTEYTNNAAIEPSEVTLDIQMSDVITSAGSLTNGGADRSVNAFQKLKSIQQERGLATITTRMSAYTNMLIQSIITTEDESNPHGMTASVTFHEVMKTVKSFGNASSTVTQTNTDSGTVQAEEDDGSLLYQLNGRKVIWGISQNPYLPSASAFPDTSTITPIAKE